MQRDAELLDLVCGPASPLPEAHQRYRLIQHLATGGQAEVYRAVRLSGGVSSAPVTVKVFRGGDSRPLADQLRSWDKGDAVLMDLNSRGVPGICRRADGFYGPPPHPPGRKPKGDPAPYQVLDYLPGVNLRDYVRQRPGSADGVNGAGADGGASSGGRLDAVGTLDTLVRVLLALHHPAEPGASPVVHMDIKPSNVMVLPNGDIRLIDFTGARYHRRDHMTTIAYTREAGGPEAFTGQVGPAYDVHGFGAVAYYMITGTFPRTESPEHRQWPGDAELPPWAVLRRHPVLDAQPTLREHLLAPLADRPEDRPGTEELTSWTARLADLVERSDTPDVGLFWGVSRSARVVGRAVAPSGTVAAAGDGAWHRIERLEQEVVELRAALAEPRSAASGHQAGAGTTRPASGAVAGAAAGLVAAGAGASADRPLWPERSEQPTVRHQPSEPATRRTVDPTRAMPRTGPDRTPSGGPPPSRDDRPMPDTRVMAGGRQGPQQGPHQPAMRGVASVPQPVRRRGDDEIESGAGPTRPPLRPLPGARIDTLRRGMGISMTCALFAFVCWGIYAIANRQANFVHNLLMFVLVLVVAVGLFMLCRLVGRLVFESMMRRSRSSARLSHLAVGIYLVAVGVGFASQVSWVNQAYDWVTHQIH